MNSKVNELQVLEQNSNAIVEAFKTEGGAKALFDRIAEQARSVVPDLSTDKGRKAIASMARKVASTKTAFDAHGKELKEQYTVITNKIDADRKLFRDSCDALRDEIRKPLTEWEVESGEFVVVPKEPTDAIKTALSYQCFDLIKVAQIYRDHGFDIPKKAEDEQSFFLHKFLILAVKHGNNFVKVFNDETKAMIEAAQENSHE